MAGLLTEENFRRLFQTFDHTMFRLETLDVYNAPYEQEELRAFLAGEPPPEPDPDDWWYPMLREGSAAGKRHERVHIVSEPLTDYLRWELTAQKENMKAGEDIRILTRDRARTLDLDIHDYWLFDSSRLALMHYDETGQFLGAELVEDSATIVKHCYWRDVAWHYAVPLEEYARGHPQL